MGADNISKEEKRSYVYIIFRRNGIPCYVGQGVGYRYKRHGFNKNSRNPHLAVIYQASEDPLPVAIIRDGLSRDEAIEIEAAFIRAIGREANGGPLVNLTDGGEGSLGWKASEEWRKHRSDEAKKLWKNTEYREKMLRPDRERSGNKTNRTEEFKASMAKRLMGNTHTLGLKHSEETKKKMSVSRKGKPKSQEFKDKIRFCTTAYHQRINLEYDMP
ncbi:MAG: NUMOD3 domain-containing DNA-binding protein [Acidithiobacillus ferriphilus]